MEIENLKYSIFSFFLLIAFTAYVNAADTHNKSIQWQEWSDSAFAQAKQENKLVLLDLKAQWCTFCKKMANVTYQDPEVIKIINKNFIAIRADIETTKPVAKRYGYFGVPGTIILTGDNKELNRRLGYIKPQFMQWHLLGILQDSQPQDKSLKTSSEITQR